MSIAAKKSKKIDMINGPLISGIVRFSLPIMATGILQHLYNAADIMVVGKFAGHIAQGAVTSTVAVVGLITNASIGLSVGANVIVARMIGAKNKEGIHRAVHTSIALSLICGLIISIIGLTFTEPLLNLMGCPREMIDLSALYVKILLLGAPINMLYNFGASVLRASGDTKRPLIFLAVSGLVNVALNLVFVIVFEMSVAGVALATIASQLISAVLVTIVLVRDKGDVKLVIKKIRIYKNELINIIKVGLPSGAQSVIFSLSNVIIQSSYNLFGPVAVSGVGVGGSIDGFVYLSMNAVYQAALTFTSQNYGAANYSRLNKILRSSVLVAVVSGIVVGGITIIFGRPLASIYTNEPKVVEYALERVYIMSSTYFLCGIMDVLSGMLRGINHSVYPMIVSVVGICGFRILWICTVFKYFFSLTTIYISYPLSWIIAFIAMYIGYMVFYKKLIKRSASESEADLSAK
ncbi:MAG: MATE family efflux transporter [Clostridia bacterium]|nr:MATE family efflux transporter [Clostridia bacterium]